MKKLLSLLLAMLLLFSLISCNNGSDDGEPDDENTVEDGNNNGSGNDGDEDIGGDDNVNEGNDGETGDEENSDNNEETIIPICDNHSYVDNTCSVCGCSLWNGDVDTSWYSVINMEFTISTAEQLAGLIEIVNTGTDFSGAKVTVSNHIDMNNIPIAPIGATNENPFSGEFDGGEYTISNIVYNDDSIILSISEYDNTLSYAYVGLFGYSNGSISNINVSNLSIDLESEDVFEYRVGGLVSHCMADIENCSVQGSISVKSDSHFSVGGLVCSLEGNISNSKTDVVIDTHLNCKDYGVSPVVAGLAVYTGKIQVDRCSSKGEVTFKMSECEVEIDELHVAGLIGVSSESKISNCYSNVNVRASVCNNNICYAGGLVGYMAKGRIEACYSTGDVSLSCYEKGYAGSLVGRINTGYFSSVLSMISVKDCFAIGDVICSTKNNDAVAASIGEGADEVGTNCFYLSDMAISGDNRVKDGSPAGINDLKNIAFYDQRMPWDREIWNIVDGELPVLN